MNKILLFLILVSFSAMAFCEKSFIENEVLMSKLMPLPLNIKWEKIKEEELPKEFREDHPLSKERVFIVGYKVSQANNLAVILEIEKPYPDETETFCRSRISVYYLYSYVPGDSYQGKPRNTFIDVGEFVNFDEVQLEEGCPSSSHKDMKNYTLVQSLYSDDILIPLFEAAKKNMSKGDTLMTIGVSRSGSESRANSYYATVSKENGKIATFKLFLSSSISFDQGAPYVTE